MSHTLEKWFTKPATAAAANPAAEQPPARPPRVQLPPREPARPLHEKRLAESDSDDDDDELLLTAPPQPKPEPKPEPNPEAAVEPKPEPKPEAKHARIAEGGDDDDDELLSSALPAVRSEGGAAHGRIADSDEDEEDSELPAARRADDDDDGRSTSEDDEEEEQTVEVMDRHRLSHNVTLCVSSGSVLDFGNGTAWPAARTAVVNAANQGGLGGGGVDGAFNSRGGEQLRRDRKALPVLPEGGRIREGGAVSTGPRKYGDLFAHTVIHAVGPHYSWDDDEHPESDALVADAYEASMAEARTASIEYLGFSLLSAGIFRGGRALPDVLRIGMDAIAAHVYPGLKEVHMVGFQGQEKKVLCRCLQERKERHGNESKRQREEQSEAAPPSHAAKTPKSAAPRQSKLKLNRGSPKKAARQDPEEAEKKKAAAAKSFAYTDSAPAQDPEQAENKKPAAAQPSPYVDAATGYINTSPAAPAAPSRPSSQQKRPQPVVKTESDAPPPKKAKTSPAPKSKPAQKPKQPKGRAKLAKAANAKGQMSLGFAAAVQPGGKAELVAINQRPKDAGGGAEAGSGQASAAESMQQLLVRRMVVAGV